MKTLRITLFAALVAAFFTGCVGPEGPQGPAGYNGANGAPGVNGSYSTGVSNPTDWSASSGFLIAGYNVSIIDSYADANGVVMVYFQTSGMGATQWAPLPDTYPVGAAEQTFTFNYDVGLVTLQLQNSDGSTPTAPPAFNFKVVVIPTAILKQHPGFNVKDYSMVKQLLRIND
jgi:hypothetical protein